MLRGHNITRRSKRSMGSHDNSVLNTVVDERISLEVRLALELVHSDRLLGDLLDGLDIFNLMVRESDVSA